MPTATTNPRHNHLLAALPEPEYSELRSHLELVQLDLGKTIHGPGGKVNNVFFPTTAIVSLLNIMENGASAEVAVVGNDGIVGVALLMGGETMLNSAVVQNAGEAYRLSAPLLKRALTRTGGRRQAVLPPLLLRYTQSLLTQMAQTAICNRHHTVDQQLCRCLLLSLDRLPSVELNMTQELIAHMLGVRREGVTEAAGRLRRDGVIEYSRGRITVLNRPSLEARVCECYEVVRKESCRLLPELTPPH